MKMRFRKKLIIDATSYPFVRVVKLLSARAITGNKVLDGMEETSITSHSTYHDYQPEDIEGGDNQWLKEQNKRAQLLRLCSLRTQEARSKQTG